MTARKLTRFSGQEAEDRLSWRGYLSVTEVDNMLMAWLECPSWDALCLEIQQVREQLNEPREEKP